MARRALFPRSVWLRATLAAAICAPALWQLWLAVSVFLGRYDYPFDIDWLESSALYQAWRMMEGQYTYDVPERGYLPLFHPIGYPAMLAVVGKVFGLDYGIARSLSFIAFLGVMALPGIEIVRHAGKDRALGIALATLSVGLACSCLPLTAGFFDLVRNDTISWLLCAAGAVLATPRRGDPDISHRRLVWLSAVMVLGVYTRLLTVFPFFAVGIFVLVRNWRTGLRLAAYVIAGCAVVLVGLQLMSKGWYFTYTVTLLQGHKVHAHRFVMGANRILEFLPFLLAIPALAIALGVLGRLSYRAQLWSAVFVSSIPAALLPLAKDGGADNDYMPVGLFVGPAAAFVLLDLSRWISNRPSWRKAASFAPYVVAAGASLFLASRPFDANAFIPDEARWQNAEALNASVASMKGGVLAPCHPFLPIRNGHRNAQYSEMPYLDAYWSKLPGLALGPYVEAADAEWVLLTGFELSYTAGELSRMYELQPTNDLPRTPNMMVGQIMKISHVMRRKGPQKNERVLFDFESSTNDWKRVGRAFEHSPSVARPKHQSPIFGVVGEMTANTFHPKLGDKAKGTLTSPPFVIDRNTFAISVGGGHSMRAQLLIEGRVARSFYPKLYSREVLLQTSIDVSAHMGKEAQIRLEDRSARPWGHLLADQAVLYDR